MKRIVFFLTTISACGPELTPEEEAQQEIGTACIEEPMTVGAAHQFEGVPDYDLGVVYRICVKDNDTCFDWSVHMEWACHPQLNVLTRCARNGTVCCNETHQALYECVRGIEESTEYPLDMGPIRVQRPN